MTFNDTPLVVDAHWLAEHLGSDGLVVLDASWHLPAEGRDPCAEYRAQHIPGAQFFDIEAISDPADSCPHMLPSAGEFAHAVTQLGIGRDTRVVIYDSRGLFSAPRAWWMFRVFGHDRVHVLCGGLPGWVADGFEVTDERTAPRHVERPFAAHLISARLADAARVKASLHEQGTVILDARSQARFSGEEAEPRPELRSGHIPGSCNLHYARLLTGDPGRLRDPEALRDLFSAAGVTPETEVITTCGSGISACILALGLELAGFPAAAVYDGSWAQWGAQADWPLERG